MISPADRHLTADHELISWTSVCSMLRSHADGQACKPRAYTSAPISCTKPHTVICSIYTQPYQVCLLHPYLPKHSESIPGSIFG